VSPPAFSLKKEFAKNYHPSPRSYCFFLSLWLVYQSRWSFAKSSLNSLVEF
jgi:hypothetical protein